MTENLASKNLFSTSESRAEHLFTHQNTQQLFEIEDKENIKIKDLKYIKRLNIFWPQRC